MLKVTTESGSTYLFDNKYMTWARVNKNPGHENITFLEGVHAGRLASEVEPMIGETLTFFMPDGEWVTTTPVEWVEEVESSEEV